MYACVCTFTNRQGGQKLRWPFNAGLTCSSHYAQPLWWWIVGASHGCPVWKGDFPEFSSGHVTTAKAASGPPAVARSPEEELEQQLQMEAAGQLFGFLTLSVQQYQRHRIATPHRNSREICLYHLAVFIGFLWFFSNQYNDFHSAIQLATFHILFVLKSKPSDTISFPPYFHN